MKGARFEPKHGLSTPKPGSLLKSAIAVRTWTDWDDARAGFFEIDLVAHCGDTTEGIYLNTLIAADIATGWTECLALTNKTRAAVSQAIIELRQHLPFALLGLDSDNGSELINDTLYRYCLTEQITFTRSRPHRKNDQAHVEQNNWSVVRHTIDYDGLKSEAEHILLAALYTDLRLYVNFFQPVLKLTSKRQVDGKTVKQYDQAATPFRRVLPSGQVAPEAKVFLSNQYVRLNPVTLHPCIDANGARLWKIA